MSASQYPSVFIIEAGSNKQEAWQVLDGSGNVVDLSTYSATLTFYSMDMQTLVLSCSTSNYLSVGYSGITINIPASITSTLTSLSGQEATGQYHNPLCFECNVSLAGVVMATMRGGAIVVKKGDV